MIQAGNVLTLPHGDLMLPAFLPDATRGVVRAVDSTDLEACGVAALVMNTYHLMQNPGSTTIRALGGLHRMSGWPRPIMTDSGGFQIYSLIRQNPKYGRLTDKGALFTPDGSDRKYNLTPEKSIQLQMSYGADILVCLDDCTHVDDPLEEQRRSVRRTVEWARRAKREFVRLVEEKRMSQRPLLFAVIQGGGSVDLRRECAGQLLEIGFDGYGYGGWPLDSDGNLLTDMLALTRELVPPELPIHALGVGHPVNVVTCARMGYPLFDSAMPTRDARNGRLYTFTTSDPRQISGQNGEWLAYLYVGDDKHIKSDTPISPYCTCATCSRYSLGYVHHLYKINDALYLRLATIHNLRFMMQLAAYLQKDRP
jgi:queuine tRNA-ribosyltransferase